MQEENVAVDNSNTTQEVAPQATEEQVETSETTEETSEEASEEESPEELQERLEKAEELAKNYKIRAEKAERLAKAKPPVGAGELNSKELLAIVNARVPEDDIDEVVQYARYKKTSVSEVLKDPIMKATLKLRAEERETAEATNTSTSRRGYTKVPDEILLANASKGKFPENDSEIQRLMKAKLKASK